MGCWGELKTSVRGKTQCGITKKYYTKKSTVTGRLFLFGETMTNDKIQESENDKQFIEDDNYEGPFEPEIAKDTPSLMRMTIGMEKPPKVGYKKIGGTYYLTWRQRIGRYDNGVPKYKQYAVAATKDKKMLLMIMAEKQRELEYIAAGIIPPKKGIKDVSLEDAYNAYLEKRKNPEIAKYAIEDFTDKMKINDIRLFNVKNINSYIDLSLKDRNPAGVKRYVGVLKNFGTFLKEEEILPNNPTVGTKIITVGRKKLRYLNDEEISIYFNTAWGKYLMMGIIGIYTGFRPGEILVCCFSDFDLTRDTVTVSEKKQFNWTPKNERTRIIPLAAELREHVLRWKKHAKKDLIIYNEKLNLPINEKSMGHMFRTHLVPKVGIHHLVPYSFRHTFAAKYLFKMKDLYGLSNLLGHSSVKTTEHYYAHLLTGYHDEGIANMSYPIAGE
jgi:integrase